MTVEQAVIGDYDAYQPGSASPDSFVKWLTLWRYLHGYLSYEGCEAAFRAHSEWRSA
jgi:hypothetical protein